MSLALGSPYEISGAAHLPSGIDRVAQTLLRVEGFKDSVIYRIQALKKILNGFGAMDHVEGSASEALWRNIRDARFLAQSDECIWRISVAPSKAISLLDQIGATAQRWFMDWGGGLIWLATRPDGDAGARVIRDATRAHKAHATLIRAPLSLRAECDVFEPQAAPIMALSQGIKQAFDPDGLFNQGRMAPGL